MSSRNLFLDPFWETTYDELITFYPRYYRDVYEMVEILKAEGGVFDDAITGAATMFDNLFIDTADETTIRALERFIGINLYSSRTLDERRRFVRAFFTGFGRVSASGIAETIRAYTGAETECRFEPFDSEGNNKLYIDFQRGDEETLYYSDIIQILSRMIPAHIEYRAALTYRFPLGVERSRKHYIFGYEFAGTKPESVLIGALHEVDSATEPSPLRGVTDYIPCGTINAHS